MTRQGDLTGEIPIASLATDIQYFVNHFQVAELRSCTICNKPFTGGQDAHPTRNSVFVERASCLFLRMVQHMSEDNPQVTERLLTLMEQVAVGGRQVHDANIVATMQAYGINQLLTHNTVDFDRFAELITVLPLVENDA
jgi:hypothetical protein